MNNHKSIQKTEYPQGWQPRPQQTQPDYNRQMKVWTSRVNNWFRFVKRSVN